LDTADSRVKVSELPLPRNRYCEKSFYEAINHSTRTSNPGWKTHQLIMVKHLQISGRVQGVGFRYHAIKAARELGVTGWVRNRYDGSVEAMVQGAPEAVDAMIAWARRGPPGAVVTDVRIAEGSGEFLEFGTLPTE